MLRRVLILLAAVVLVAAACGSDDDGDTADPVVTADTTPFETPAPTTPPEVPADLVGSWIVVSAGDEDAPDGVTLLVSEGGPVTGFLGCNEMTATVGESDGTLAFSGVAYTEIGCEGIDDFVVLADSLETVDGYAVDGESAQLSSADSVVVVLQRTDDLGPA